MALRPIIILPDPKLRLKSAPVERVDGELLKLADDMLETMYDAPASVSRPSRSPCRAGSSSSTPAATRRARADHLHQS